MYWLMAGSSCRCQPCNGSQENKIMGFVSFGGGLFIALSIFSDTFLVEITRNVFGEKNFFFFFRHYEKH